MRIYRRRQLHERFAAAGLELVASHHAHALHSPYWWLRCLVGVDNENCAVVPRLPPPPRLGHHGATVVTRTPEQILNPLMGKSLVAYLRRREP